MCGGSDIPFDTNRTINGTALSHVQGNTDFVTLVPGNYHVRFTTTATPTAAGCPMGAAASVAIALNGQPIAGSTVTETAVLNQQVSLATQAIVTVNCGEVARISVRNMSASQTIFVEPSITIVRLS